MSKERKKIRSDSNSRQNHRRKNRKTRKKNHSKDFLEPVYILEPGPSQISDANPPLGFHSVLQGPLCFHANPSQSIWNPYRTPSKQLVFFSDRMDDPENPSYVVGGSQTYSTMSDRGVPLQSTSQSVQVDAKRATNSPRFVTQVSVYDEPSHESTAGPPGSRVMDPAASNFQRGTALSKSNRGNTLGASGFQSNAGVMASDFLRGTNVPASGFQSGTGIMPSEFHRSTGTGPSGYQSNAGVMASDFLRGTAVPASGFQSGTGLKASEFQRGTGIGPSGYQSNAGLMASDFLRGTNVPASGFQSGTGLMASEFQRGTNVPASGFQSGTGLMASEFQRGTVQPTSGYQSGVGLMASDFQRGTGIGASGFKSSADVMASEMQGDPTGSEYQRPERLTQFRSTRQPSLGSTRSTRGSSKMSSLKTSFFPRGTAAKSARSTSIGGILRSLKSSRSMGIPSESTSYETIEEVDPGMVMMSRAGSNFPVSGFMRHSQKSQMASQRGASRSTRNQGSEMPFDLPVGSYISADEITEVNLDSMAMDRASSAPGLIKTEDVINDLYGKINDIRSCLCPSSFNVAAGPNYSIGTDFARATAVPKATQSFAPMSAGSQNCCCPCIKPQKCCCDQVNNVNQTVLYYERGLSAPDLTRNVSTCTELLSCDNSLTQQCPHNCCPCVRPAYPVNNCCCFDKRVASGNQTIMYFTQIISPLNTNIDDKRIFSSGDYDQFIKSVVSNSKNKEVGDDQRYDMSQFSDDFPKKEFFLKSKSQIVGYIDIDTKTSCNIVGEPNDSGSQKKFEPVDNEILSFQTVKPLQYNKMGLPRRTEIIENNSGTKPSFISKRNSILERIPLWAKGVFKKKIKKYLKYSHQTSKINKYINKTKNKKIFTDNVRKGLACKKIYLILKNKSEIIQAKYRNVSNHPKIFICFSKKQRYSTENEAPKPENFLKTDFSSGLFEKVRKEISHIIRNKCQKKNSLPSDSFRRNGSVENLRETERKDASGRSESYETFLKTFQHNTFGQEKFEIINVDYGSSNEVLHNPPQENQKPTYLEVSSLSKTHDKLWHNNLRNRCEKPFDPVLLGNWNIDEEPRNTYKIKIFKSLRRNSEIFSLDNTIAKMICEPPKIPVSGCLSSRPINSERTWNNVGQMLYEVEKMKLTSLRKPIIIYVLVKKRKKCEEFSISSENIAMRKRENKLKIFIILNCKIK